MNKNNRGRGGKPQQQRAPKEQTERANVCITSAWKERTAEMHDRIMQQLDVMKTPQIVFLGDSLMERWKTSGKEKWEQLTSTYKVLNCGIGGDKVQNVLWRLEKGLFETMRPKLIFFMIGTNNIEKNSAKHIAEGTEKIIQLVHEKSPDSLFVIYGVLPRTTSDKLPVPIMDKIHDLNQLVKGMAENQFKDFATFIDIGEHFLEQGSTDRLQRSLFDDKVHISKSGYDKWYELLVPVIKDKLN
jgi:lysophospholipase L1-like esterase